jgi:thiol-disulfide isomerase/thioredoxin
MKQKHITTLCFYLVTLLYSSTYAQQKSQTKYVTIDLIVQDKSMLDSASIRFELSRNGVNSNMSAQSDTYEFKISKAGTRFKIPLSTSINYGRINYFFKGQERLKPFDEAAVSRFIFERGDTLQLLINKNSFSFKGKDSDKYTCIQSIYEQEIKGISTKIENIYQLKRYDQMLAAQKERLDSLYLLKTNILNSYQKKLNPVIYKLLLADSYGSYQDRLLGYLLGRIVSNGIRNETDTSIVKAYHLWFNNLSYPLKEDTLLVKSFQFCDFLYKKETFDAMFFISPKPGQYNFRFTFPQIFSRINQAYSGIILDKLNLMNFYQSLTKSEGTTPYLTEALAKMQNNTFKETLAVMVKNYSGKAFAFELQDQFNHTIKLSDFKGKLVVMDFWFTGCLGCRLLAEQMKAIVQHYSTNKNVVFITVSIDKNKEVWLKSLKDETYTTKHEINLFTNGLGEQHPIIEFYNIHGYPTLIIISKDGKLISSAPPRPEKGKPEKAIEFIYLIDKNL